jgi:hypothetical protein
MMMGCCLTPSVSGQEDFVGPAGGGITLRLEGDPGTGAEIVHIRYDTDPIDAEPPLQFTIKRGSKMLVVLVEASAPGARLRLVEVCGDGREQVIDRFHFDPRNPARGYVITGR